jgi:hypothetical protein
LFDIDGRRDRLDEATSVFRNFGNASKTGAQTCFKNLIQEYYSTFYIDGNMDIMLTELNFLDDFMTSDKPTYFEILRLIADNAC